MTHRDPCQASATALPGYAIDLLYAAKMAAHPPIGVTPEMLGEIQQQLSAAVSAFEAAMPVVDGVIAERGTDAGA